MAVALKHLGSWLLAVPSRACGLGVCDETVVQLVWLHRMAHTDFHVDEVRVRWQDRHGLVINLIICPALSKAGRSLVDLQPWFNGRPSDGTDRIPWEKGGALPGM